MWPEAQVTGTATADLSTALRFGRDDKGEGGYGPKHRSGERLPQISPLRYASVEMTKGSTALSTLSKNIPREGPLKPQISPLRSFGAPIEMTKGRVALREREVAE